MSGLVVHQMQQGSDRFRECRPSSPLLQQPSVADVLQVDVCIPAARKGPARQLAAALAGTVTGAAADAAVRAPIQAAGRSGACLPCALDLSAHSDAHALLTGGVTSLSSPASPMRHWARSTAVRLRLASARCNSRATVA
jgi:hypothetical protein